MRPVLSVARRAGPGEPTPGGLKSRRSRLSRAIPSEQSDRKRPLSTRSALTVLGDLARLRVVDLTRPLHPGMPYWPGDGYGPFRYVRINVFERDGKAAGLFEMPEHMGTHIDAPNHFVASGPAVDCLNIDQLLRPAVTFDIVGGSGAPARVLAFCDPEER